MYYRKILFLDELGFPNVYMSDDYTLCDIVTHREFRGYPTVTISDHHGNTRDFNRNKLYRWCFLAPWRHGGELSWVDISSLGYPFYAATDDGHIFGYRNMNYLSEDISDDGYPEVVLYDFNKERHYFNTHQIIARAFIPNPDCKNTVNHINGIKTDNRACNLEWMWMWENMDHALKTGLKHSAMTDDMVREVCLMLSNNVPICDIAEKVGCKYHNIKDILDGCHYRISKDYPNIPYLNNARHIPKEFIS